MKCNGVGKRVRLLIFQSSTRRWAELHEEAFRRGSVKVVILDNLKEGVTQYVHV